MISFAVVFGLLLFCSSDFSWLDLFSRYPTLITSRNKRQNNNNNNNNNRLWAVPFSWRLKMKSELHVHSVSFWRKLKNESLSSIFIFLQNRKREKWKMKAYVQFSFFWKLKNDKWKSVLNFHFSMKTNVKIQ